MTKNKLAEICVNACVALVIDLLLAFPVMWLWNWLIVGIFGLKVITFFEALGLLFLSDLLFNQASYITKEKQ